MTRTLKLLLSLLITATAIAGCDTQQISTNQVDSKSLVAYYMPASWSNTAISSGDHFKRVDRPDDPAVLAVISYPGPLGLPVAEIIEGRRAKHEIQGHTELQSSERQERGFTVWEGIYSLDRQNGKSTLHEHLFFTDDFYFEVYLGALEQDYPQYLADMAAVLDSVRIGQADPGA